MSTQVCHTCNGTGIEPDRRTCWQKTSRFTYVYIMLGTDDECLYIGITDMPRERWNQHKRTSPELTAQVVRCRRIGPFTRDRARRAEIEQQLLLRPRYNKFRRADVEALAKAAS